MKNLNGYLKKILSLFNTLILFLSFFTFSYAENIAVTASFNHEIDSDSVHTQVILSIVPESPRVITYYTASIPLANLKPKCKNYETNEEIECIPYHRGTTTDVMLKLNNSVMRPEKPFEVLLEYSTASTDKNSFTVISEVLDTKTNSVNIRYPKSMGEPFWSSEPIQSISQKAEDYFQIHLENPNTNKISFLFGKSVYYRFDINKVLSNTLEDKDQTFEIYIPSDTYTQTIIWEEITPTPTITLLDEDGNYIFKYILSAKETVDCKISGYIQMTKSSKQEKPSQSFLTQQPGYWTIENSTEFVRINTFLKKKGLKIDSLFENIEQLEKNEQEFFYKYIYQYVKERLNHNPDIVLGISNEVRKGANTLIESPDTANPIDYADFLIAILRKYKVPARLIIGYVSNITGYSADGFYHQWVEYFDYSKDEWITVDPFLDSYLKKDLFGSSFYDHIVIIKRGKFATSPKISFFGENDFIVKSETKKKITPEFNIDTSLSFSKLDITKKIIQGTLTIHNTGNIAINGYEILKTNIDKITSYIDPINNMYSKIILPDKSAFIQFNIPVQKIEDHNIFVETVIKNGENYKKESLVKSTITERPPFYITVLSKIISLLLFVLVVFLVYLGVKRIQTKSKSMKKKKKNG